VTNARHAPVSMSQRFGYRGNRLVKPAGGRVLRGGADDVIGHAVA